jgi:hypothetical protein
MLTKQASRERWREVRSLVNEWDPIGLISAGAPDDEYECVVGPVLRMLETSEAPETIGAYLEIEFAEHFGMPGVAASEFAVQAHQWYESDGQRAPCNRRPTRRCTGLRPARYVPPRSILLRVRVGAGERQIR